MSRLLASCCAAVVLTASTTACSGTHHGSNQRAENLTGTITAVLKQKPRRRGLHIYDARRIAKTTVTSADIDRSSIRVVPLSKRYAALYVGFTRRGRLEFCRLTRALARRGARIHRHQYLIIAADGRVFARPWIDYQKFPNGLCGVPGFESDRIPIRAARDLAKLIRNG
jgi:hypothetical protein